MSDERLEQALKQIQERYPGMVPGVALERAIELMQVEAIGDLTDAIRDQTLILDIRKKI